ncbi:MAG: hypothetical protein HN826_15605, partial [Methylococcales bacterium]|nr:hypothetical protein [Methylococcales bacterium]
EILQEKYQLLSNKQTQYEKNISKLVKNLKENIQTLLDQKTQLKEKNDLKIDKQNKIITQLVNKNKSHNQNVLGLEQTVQQLKKDNSQLLQQQSIQNKTMQNSNENKKAFTVLKQELSNKEFLINILTGCIILLILLQLFMKSKHNSRRKRQPLQQENPNIETFKVAQLVDLDQNHQVEQDLLDNKKITIDDEKIELQLRFNFDVNTVHH